MPMFRRTYKVRIFPTKTQTRALNHQLAACRWVYNQCLALRKGAWEERQERVSYYDAKKMIPLWKAEVGNEWLAFAGSNTLQDACKRQDLALKAFFRRVKAKEEEVGYPKFKNYRTYNSLTHPAYGNGVQLIDGKLYLIRIGVVKINITRPIEGKIKTVTIRRDNLGKWFATFSCEVEIEPEPPVDQSVGIDMGLEKFATLSDGQMVPNPRFFRRDERDLAKAQRKVELWPKGSPERKKAIRKVQHIHARIAGRRKNFAHQLSRYLVNNYQLIGMEDLSITNMMQNHHLAKSIGDAAWNLLVQQVQYKSESAGRTAVLVNPAYTSQDCSGCGYRAKKSLLERWHNCPECGLSIDRDVNAAINILAKAVGTLFAET